MTQAIQKSGSNIRYHYKLSIESKPKGLFLTKDEKFITLKRSRKNSIAHLLCFKTTESKFLDKTNLLHNTINNC